MLHAFLAQILYWLFWDLLKERRESYLVVPLYDKEGDVYLRCIQTANKASKFSLPWISEYIQPSVENWGIYLEHSGRWRGVRIDLGKPESSK